MSSLDRVLSRVVDAPVLSAFANGRSRSSDKQMARVVRGKIVLVTGSSFGIGEATARRVAAHGGIVLLVARSAERLEELAAEIRLTGGVAHALPADLGDAAQVDALVERVLAEFGHVDVLVNNAGKSIRRSVIDAADPQRDVDRLNAVNYLGPVRLTLGLLPAMKARRSGHIVTTATVGTKAPSGARWSGYLASKGAFDVWIRSVGQEARRYGITTTSVYMGLVRTRMSAPTKHWQAVPGLTPEAAAALLCDAIVRRPATIGPWWAGAAGVLGQALRGPLESYLAWQYGRLDAPPVNRSAAGGTAAAQPPDPSAADRDRRGR